MLRKAHHHHIAYRSAGGDNSTANLITLCASCHEDEHMSRMQIEAETEVGADGPVSFWYWSVRLSEWICGHRESEVGRVARD